MFLGAGDTLGPTWLSSVAACCEDYDVVYGSLMISFDQSLPSRLSRSRNWIDASRRMPYEMAIPHVGSAHHRRLFEQNQFDSSYRIIGDWEFLVRACKGKGLFLENEVQAVMAWGGTSNQAAGARRQYAEICRMLKTNGRQMPLGFRAKWFIKRSLSHVPSAYSWLQAAYWRRQTRSDA